MIRAYRSIVFILLTALLAVGCVESEFHLAKESRLPGWFEVPSGMARSDLDLVLTYYTAGPAKLTLREVRSGRVLRTIKAKKEWHPAYWEWAQRDWPKRSHPGFVILSVGGISEIIEHRRMEPIFYVSNEAAVQSAIGNRTTHNKSAQPDALTRAAGFRRYAL